MRLTAAITALIFSSCASKAPAPKAAASQPASQPESRPVLPVGLFQYAPGQQMTGPYSITRPNLIALDQQLQVNTAFLQTTIIDQRQQIVDLKSQRDEKTAEAASQSFAASWGIGIATVASAAVSALVTALIARALR